MISSCSSMSSSPPGSARASERARFRASRNAWICVYTRRSHRSPHPLSLSSQSRASLCHSRPVTNLVYCGHYSSLRDVGSLGGWSTTLGGGIRMLTREASRSPTQQMVALSKRCTGKSVRFRLLVYISPISDDNASTIIPAHIAQILIMHSFIGLPDTMRHVNCTIILYELSAGVGLPYIQY